MEAYLNSQLSLDMPPFQCRHRTSNTDAKQEHVKGQKLFPDFVTQKTELVHCKNVSSALIS